MKSKTVILGLAAIVLAIGSAFKSAGASSIARIKIRYTDQPIGSFTCQNTGRTCQQELDGPYCTVSITDLNGAAAPGLNYSCTVQLIGMYHAFLEYDHPTRTIAEIVPFD